MSGSYIKYEKHCSLFSFTGHSDLNIINGHCECELWTFRLLGGKISLSHQQNNVEGLQFSFIHYPQGDVHDVYKLQLHSLMKVSLITEYTECFGRRVWGFRILKNAVIRILNDGWVSLRYWLSAQNQYGGWNSETNMTRFIGLKCKKMI